MQRLNWFLSFQNVTANHRANDVIAAEDGPQVLVGRFMYGPLDMVALTGEKVRKLGHPLVCWLQRSRCPMAPCGMWGPGSGRAKLRVQSRETESSLAQPLNKPAAPQPQVSALDPSLPAGGHPGDG